MLHLSDIKKYDRCDKYYWFSKQIAVPYFPFATCNYNIYDLTKQYFMFQDVFEGQRGDDPAKALEAMKDHMVLMNARFAYKTLRVTVPFLVLEEKPTLILPYNACFPKEHEAQKIADMCFVLNKNGIEIEEILIVHLNADYVRQGELDVRACLAVSEYLYNDKNKAHHKAIDLAQEHYRELDDVIEAMENLPDLSQVQKKRSSACTNHFKCDFFYHCFPNDHHDTSILNLVQSQKKYELLDRGITDMAMVMDDVIEGNRYQYAQIMAAKKRGLFVDKMALHTWMKKLVYPLTYLDFEWETYVYPPYDGMKPFDVLVFQYSMHIQKEKQGKCFHEQFLSKGDCRKVFIEDLIAKIPKTGSIVVFNAVGAEALRLQQLAVQFPEYEEQLRQIWTRMVDLSVPFSSGLVYDPRMAGEYNLKKLLSLFSDLSYENLEIAQGLEAVRRWRELEQGSEESQKIEEALYAYCGMDTYSMKVLIDFLYSQLTPA